MPDMGCHLSKDRDRKVSTTTSPTLIKTPTSQEEPQPHISTTTFSETEVISITSSPSLTSSPSRTQKRTHRTPSFRSDDTGRAVWPRKREMTRDPGHVRSTTMTSYVSVKSNVAEYRVMMDAGSATDEEGRIPEAAEEGR